MKPPDRLIRTLIVDDEALARRGVRQQLERHIDIDVIGESNDGEEAVATIESERPDLVFMDIEMPEMSGLDVVDVLGTDAMPMVIFVTAYDQYALRAFDAHAVDYVLKPIDPDRFAAALDRARDRIKLETLSDVQDRLDALMSQIRRDKGQERVVVREGGRIHFVRCADIDWIEAADNYVRIHVGDHVHLLRRSLTRLEQELSMDDFARIHRSAIVRVKAIKEMESEARGDFTVLLHSGVRISGSRRHREAIRRILDGEASW